MESFKSRWSSFWIKHDPDTLFAYSTFKMVTIQDRYLGFLHHAMQFGILVYIIVFVIFIQKEFLRMEDATGIVRLSLKVNPSAPRIDPGITEHCYLDSADQNGKIPCTLPPIDQLGIGEGPNLFISTFINRSDYSAPCDTFLPDCSATQTSTSEYYVANVLSVSLSIDHAAQVDYGNEAPKGVLQTLKNPNGDTSEWKTCSDCSVNKFQQFLADSIPLESLLKAAHLDLSDIANEYLEGTSGYDGPQTYRSFGGVILLSVVYDNRENYFSKDPPILYRYRPLLITDVDDYYSGTIYTSFPYNRTVLFRKGIRIMGVVAGEIGHFTFQTLLIQLTTSLALMKVATTAVDLIALWILPDKLLYRTAKFEKTEDFSELKLKKRKSDLAESHNRELTVEEASSSTMN